MNSWNLILKTYWSELLVVNALLKLLGDPINSRFGYVFHITQFARNVDLVLTILLKYIWSWIPFLRSLICKNLSVNSNLLTRYIFKNQTRLRFHIQIWKVKIMTLLWNIFDVALWEPWNSIFVIEFWMRKNWG